MSTASSPHQGGDWTLIVPCAASIDPIAPRRPKYLLTTPEGKLLVQRAAESVPQEQLREIVVAIQTEADRRYQAQEAILRAFDGRVRCIVLDEATEGPAHTVRETIARAGLSGPIAIKDSDSFFSLNTLPAASFVAVSDLRQLPFLSEPARKSYVRLNEQGMISEMVEKSVCSNLISVGLYGFQSAALFTSTFDEMAEDIGHRKLFVSHLVARAVTSSHLFVPCEVDDPTDISTEADWADHRDKFVTLVVDIDGVVFRNQSGFFSPFWGDEVEPLRANIDHLAMLQRRGAQLIFMTARPERHRAATLEALEKEGLQVHALVMGCNHAARVLINDYAPSNAYPSAIAINIERNQARLPELLVPNAQRRQRPL